MPANTILVFLICMVIFCIIFPGCNSVMDDEDIIRLEDTIEPVVMIEKPSEGSACSSLVLVEGKVTDSASLSGKTGRIDALSFSVLGTNIGEPVYWDVSTGSFLFTFQTDNAPDSFTLELVVKDWNNNICKKTINLKKGHFPLINITPGVNEVDIEWEPVAGADQYMVYYTERQSYGFDAIEYILSGVESPVTIEGLHEGYLYIIQVRAISSGSGDDWSEPVSVIPISDKTLIPEIEMTSDSILLDWSSVAGTNVYTLFKKYGQGETEQITFQGGQTQYEDIHVSPEITYSYCLEPGTGNVETNRSQPALCRMTYSPPVHPVYRPVTRGCSVALEIKDGLIFSAVPETGLEIYDISDPARPLLVSWEYTPGWACDVAVKDDYAFIADYTSGVQIFDITNPALPKLIGSFTTPGPAYSLVWKNNYLYVAADMKGLCVYDISNPLQPELVAEVADEPLFCINMHGSFILGAGRGYGIIVYDITDPSLPVITDTYENSSLGANDRINVIHQVKGRGDYIYAADETYGLHILSLSEEGLLTHQSTFACGRVKGRGVAVRDDTVFVAGEYCINIVDASIPTSPVYIGAYTTADIYTWDMITAGDYLFAGNGPGGLHSILLGELHVQDSGGVWPSCNDARDIDIYGDFACVAAGNDGISVYTLDDPANPAFLSSYPTSGYAESVEIKGNTLYAATSEKNIDVYTITSAGFLEQQTSVSVESSISDFGIKAGILYVSTARHGLMMFDVKQEEPVFLNTYNNNHENSSILLADEIFLGDTTSAEICVVRTGGGGTMHEEISRTKLNFNPVNGIGKNGSALYFSSASWGIQVAEFIYPGVINVNTRYVTPGRPQFISHVGDYLYIADSSAGLHVLNTKETKSLMYTVRYDIPGALRCAFYGNYAYVAAGENGIASVALDYY